jgi:hypothetical protein
MVADVRGLTRMNVDFDLRAIALFYLRAIALFLIPKPA